MEGTTDACGGMAQCFGLLRVSQSTVSDRDRDYDYDFQHELGVSRHADTGIVLCVGASELGVLLGRVQCISMTDDVIITIGQRIHNRHRRMVPYLSVCMPGGLTSDGYPCYMAGFVQQHVARSANGATPRGEDLGARIPGPLLSSSSFFTRMLVGCRYGATKEIG